MSLSLFLQNIANGLSLGSLYALIAIGYTMVYGILRLINFAHGEIFMLAPYFLYFGFLIFHLPWWISTLVAIGLTALTGMLTEKIAYRPLRDAPRISVLISAIGVSFFLQNLAIVVFSGIPKSVHRPNFFTKIFQLGDIRIQSTLFASIGISIIVLSFLIYIVYRTKTGLAMRAISTDIETSRLMGIEVNRAISVTFVIGSALAAVGGILWSQRFPQLFPTMGMIPGLKAFIAAVVGGIGSIPGAMFGGFILGMSEILFVTFFPGFSGYRDAFVFLILILILLFKPDGILGKKVQEKV
ncbi:MAG: Amino acid/amide ABC transporter membrane protein 1, HAAT family [candidate division TA06 bacterium 34_109]|jgi:branched-chain amino acid transport system permease protein|uniref:Amino acid/amide ABC transporter membrane protein 1, HAAT family n=1 Tax=candidate division TA06 bacterium 34_109 TaxID=1635277 RepID=A0A101HZH1_UNCT6|nr:MAG: Amino acid/amide ABC transporter membrane protein 1, HAAT family [candidate division TA06 bacterium 34_109]